MSAGRSSCISAGERNPLHRAEQAGERAIARFRGLATPFTDLVRPMPHPRMYQLTEGGPGPEHEAARSPLTSARAAMANLAAANPALGRHLAATIRTGRYCAYLPDPRAPIAWER
jgi:hypothetical protein